MSGFEHGARPSTPTAVGRQARAGATRAATPRDVVSVQNLVRLQRAVGNTLVTALLARQAEVTTVQGASGFGNGVPLQRIGLGQYVDANPQHDPSRLTD